MGYSMKTEQFRYTEWQDKKTGKILARELYDHAKDPNENTNAADNPQYQHQIQTLAKTLKAGWKPARPN